MSVRTRSPRRPGNYGGLQPVLCTNKSAGVVEPSGRPRGRWCGLGGTVKDFLTHGASAAQLSPGIWMDECVSDGTQSITKQGWTQARLRAFLTYAGEQGARTVTLWSGLTATPKWITANTSKTRHGDWPNGTLAPWSTVFPSRLTTCPWCAAPPPPARSSPPASAPAPGALPRHPQAHWPGGRGGRGGGRGARVWTVCKHARPDPSSVERLHVKAPPPNPRPCSYSWRLLPQVVPASPHVLC